MLIIIAIVLGLVLDLIVWRRRDLAFCIFYYELIYSLLTSFVPYDFGEYGYLLYFYVGQFYYLFCCEARHQIYVATIYCLLITLGIYPLVYKIEVSVGYVLEQLLIATALFVVCSVHVVVLTYIAIIRGKMRKLMLENFTLFNKMNEGLIVLSKSDNCL